MRAAQWTVCRGLHALVAAGRSASGKAEGDGRMVLSTNPSGFAAATPGHERNAQHSTKNHAMTTDTTDYFGHPKRITVEQFAADVR